MSLVCRLALVASIACSVGFVAAQEVDHSKMDHSAMDHSQMDHGAVDHSAHMAQASSAGAKIKRSEMEYTLADVKLTRQDGQAIKFASAVNDGRPVLLNFIYTSCTAICPVTSKVFSDVREKLGNDRDKVNMISVSIDPEYDTPARLTQYAERFGATRVSWNFYTGTAKESVSVQKSFASYQGDKMNHIPVTFLRAAPTSPWVRIDGFASPELLLAELRPLLKM
jgi:protein SCO1/2